MGKIFSLDSKFMRVMGKVSDLMILNLLTMVCCIPIVTIGASFTAMHYVLLRIYREEEGAISKQFFKAFRDNFKQSTMITLIYALLSAVIVVDVLLFMDRIVQVSSLVRYGLLAASLLLLVSYTWVFVLQSRYEDKVHITIRNSFVVGITKILNTIMMLLFDALPFLVMYYFMELFPLVIFLGFTVPGYLKAMLYSRVFDQLEGVNRNEEPRLSSVDREEEL